MEKQQHTQETQSSCTSSYFLEESQLEGRGPLRFQRDSSVYHRRTLTGWFHGSIRCKLSTVISTKKQKEAQFRVGFAHTISKTFQQRLPLFSHGHISASMLRDLQTAPREHSWHSSSGVFQANDYNHIKQHDMPLKASQQNSKELSWQMLKPSTLMLPKVKTS